MIRAAALATVVVLGACAEPPQFLMADGVAGSYDDWQGRWVVINYWAEWCAPCRHEIPELNRLHAAREAIPAVVVGVNFDGLEGEPLRALIARMGIEFPVVVGAPRLHYEYPLPTVLPTTVVIAPDGTLAATLVGPQTIETIAKAWSAPEGTTGG